MTDDVQTKHKFEENIQLELKNNADEQTIAAFQKVAKALDGEGQHYSITRESFIKFFNDLSDSQQKEFLAKLSAEQDGRNIYDIAQEYNALLLKKK